MNAWLRSTPKPLGFDPDGARLARDLHDSLGKTLYGLVLAAEAIPHWIERDTGTAAVRAQAVARSARAALDDLRALLAGLRADVPSALPQAVRAVVATWSSRSGIATTTKGDQDEGPTLSAHIRREALAILDECLTNVDRHSGARRVTVTLRCYPAVELTVRDDGRGFDVDAVDVRCGHFGLLGMAERARNIGGRLTVRSVRGEGAEIHLRAPVPASMSARGPARAMEASA